MNNPLQMLGALKNPQEFIQQAMNNNQTKAKPIAKNAIQSYQRGDKDRINKRAENLCK